MEFGIEKLMIVGVVCVVVFIAGYKTLAVGLFIIMVFATLITGVTKKKPVPSGQYVEGIKVKGANVLEPVVIETTRGPPFRIPARMDIRIKPTWSAMSWIEKVGHYGVGRPARMAYRNIMGREE